MTNLITSEAQVKELDYTKCGRTDKGVSAAGNVFSMFLPVRPKDEKLLIKRINSALPQEICIFGMAKVPADFNSRNNCTFRTYRYYFLAEGLEIELMRKAAGFMEGNNDFRLFCKMKPEYERSGTVRKIFSCKIFERDSMEPQTDLNGFEGRMKVVYLEISGSGFLWHMVDSSGAVCYGHPQGDRSEGG